MPSRQPTWWEIHNPETILPVAQNPHGIPAGRPIISDCGSETCHTAKFIDFYLNPLSTRHPSYLKDTWDFIAKIKNIHIPDYALFFYNGYW